MPLHPVIAAMLEQMQQTGRPALSAGTPDEARAFVAESRVPLGPGPEIGEVKDLTIETRAGSIGARLFRPVGEPLGLIVYLHGGGWVVGTLDDFDSVARRLVEKSGCALLMPDYRLAPEHRFPAGLEDAEDALLWAAREKAALLGREVPLVLAGDSAGGNLATVLAHRLDARVPLALLVLIYPVADCDFDMRSYREYGSGLGLTRQDMQWFFDHYVSEENRADPRVSPLRTADLSGMPPTLVVTAEYDVLRDEGEALAQRLREAGVAVTLRRYDGLPHGFIRMHNLVDTAAVALGDVGAAIADACRRAQGTAH